MKTKLLLFIAVCFFSISANAQNISIVGDFNAWNATTSVDMATSNGTDYTLNNFILSASGGLKFQLDHAWTSTWGCTTFPTGTSATTIGGNIPATLGIWDITFNRLTGVFAFTPHATGFSQISVIGTAAAGATVDVDMSTVDGINYALPVHVFTAGTLKFRQDHANTINWGNASFPAGTATLGGTAINVLAGTYNLEFNKNTGVYNFKYMTISLTGDSVGGWGTDTDMVTTNGTNYTIADKTCTAGGGKFRQDHAWSITWSINTFPTGTGTSSGGDIPVTAGVWNISLNIATGAFAFTPSTLVIPVISVNGTAAAGATDVDMVTLDNGANYTLANYTFTAGTLRFRQDHANTTAWGATAFPSGTASTTSAASIAVTAGTYDLNFNRSTGAYAFNYLTMDLIGSSMGSWGTGTDMVTTDGVHYTIASIALVAGGLKIRQAHGWSITWANPAFPIGTGTSTGADITITAAQAGTYSVTFNRLTGDYVFTISLGTNDFDVKNFTVYPNPTQNSWNFTSTNSVISSIQIIDILGKTIINRTTSSNDVIIDATNLPKGLYFAKIASETSVQTLKVIKD